MRRIVIAGETYSANLGDGVIADSLAYLFRRQAPEAEVRLLDISGRAGRAAAGGAAAGAGRGQSAAARAASNWLKWQLVRRRRCARRWAPLLAGATDVVIGGGQLLMDNGLDFALKLAHLAAAARAAGAEVHVVAVGVGRQWSPAARRLFDGVLRQAASVSMRDELSAQRLAAQGYADAALGFDPAVWAAAAYGLAGRAARQPGLVGVGLLAPLAVNRHRAGHAAAPAAQLAYWAELVAALRQAERPFELFTNGSVLDYAFGQQLAAHVRQTQGVDCVLVRRPRRPTELVQDVGRYGVVLAGRLHANLISLAWQTPAVGLVWDEKVRALYADTGRAALCCDLLETPPADVVRAVQRAEAAGIDDALLARCRRQAADGVARVLARGAACG